MWHEMDEFDEDKLLFLRSNTILGPVAKLNLMVAEKNINYFRNWYFKVEGEIIDYDDTPVLELEYDLRLDAWRKKCARLWKNNGNGVDLSEFSDNVMHDCMSKSKIKKRKK